MVKSLKFAKIFDISHVIYVISDLSVVGSEQ